MLCDVNFVSFFVWTLALITQAAAESPSAGRPYIKPEERIKDRYIVKYKSDDQPRLVHLRTGGNGTAAVQSLDLADVEYIEKDQVVKLVAAPSNDPEYSKQWHLSKVSAPLAWDVSTGSRTIRVCVIDSGIDFRHADLLANLFFPSASAPLCINTIQGYSPTDCNDDNGHGTHVAGIMGAVGNNARGIAGMNWQVTILPCKSLDSQGYGTMWDAVKCVDWCKSQGAKIISASFGAAEASPSMEAAITNSGALFVSAAGNDGANLDSKPSYPAMYTLPNLVSVAASGPTDARAPFSNFHATKVHLAAPGSMIRSTARGGGYEDMSGTSMATPLVSGAAALALAAAGGKDSLTPNVLKYLLLSSVDKVPALGGLVLTGGRLNASRLVDQALAQRGLSRDGTPALKRCYGLAYDGYLGGCGVELDVPLGPGSTIVTKEGEGTFSLFAQNGTQPRAAYIVPYVGAPVTEASSEAGYVPPYCHDSVTLLPEYLPLAAPAFDCASHLAIGPASSLLLYGGGALSEAALKRQLGINSGIPVGQYDAFKMALLGDSNAAAMLAAELALKNTVLSTVKLMAARPMAVPKLARIVFRSVAGVLAAADNRAGGQPRTSLLSEQELTAIYDSARTAAVTALALGQLAKADLLVAVPADRVKAAMAAVGSMNALFRGSTSVESLQRAMQVASTSLSSSLAQLASGGITLQAFSAATSPAALSSAVEAAVLAGGLPDVGQWLSPPSYEPPWNPRLNSGWSVNRILIVTGSAVGGACAFLMLILIIRWRRRRQRELQASLSPWGTYTGPPPYIFGAPLPAGQTGIPTWGGQAGGLAAWGPAR